MLHPRIIHFAALSLLIGATPAQSIADLEKAYKAAAEVGKSVDELTRHLDALNMQARRTLRVLRASRGDIKRAGQEKPAADMGALLKAVEKLTSELDAHMEAITRIRSEGAGDEGDPLGVLQTRIATALEPTDIKKQEAGLLALKKTTGKDPRMQPFIGLLHYQIGEVLRKRASQLLSKNSKRETPKAEALLESAIRSYELTVSDRTKDVLNTSTGSSTKASALYRLVQVKGVLYDGYDRLAKASKNKVLRRKADKLGEYARQKFMRLREKYPKARLSDGRLAVDAALRDAQRMRAR